MTNPAQHFREWMDSKELRAKDVAERFGVSEQTISHWRSQGVPDRRQPHVNYVITCWEKPTAAELGSTLLLKPSAAQFNAWNQAWRHSQFATLEQWAIEGLDELAESEPTLRVAEDPSPYHTTPGQQMGNG
jgi:transcriptional regulator with XRE-family HTH domain